jgi:arginyl-tRNA synthetase
LKAHLTQLLATAAKTIAPDTADLSILLERPKSAEHGDFATNLALVLAKPLKQNPRAIATQLIAALPSSDFIAKTEIAGAGFINFFLNAQSQQQVVKTILSAGAQYGRNANGQKQKVQVEFVSANPTGPLHVGHGRGAAVGDCLARLLDANGWDVTREFYYNDAGAQIDNLTISVLARCKGIATDDARFPENGYRGEYIADIAAAFLAKQTVVADDMQVTASGDINDETAVRHFAVAYLRHEQDLDLTAFQIKFDVFSLESALYAEGKVEQTVQALINSGHTYEQDNALWLKTTAFGDDKDRVMRKSEGGYTYFVPDVAYHAEKWRRGFVRVINEQGADHHSTITRVRAGLQALDIGIPKGYPDYVLHQMVTVMKGGEEVKISKRAGSYVTVRDLIDEVGRDAVRYFYLMRKGDSQLVFDVDLARSQSEENPVYYVQMAHARMCGIFRVGEIDATTVTGDGVDLGVLSEPAEQELVKQLLDFPATVKGAADHLEPHRIAAWLLETARAGHTWYHKHHVLGEPEAITRARLVLARATQLGIAAGLRILGLSAPERM